VETPVSVGMEDGSSPGSLTSECLFTVEVSAKD
jgi:hypothetical protein